MNHLSFAICQHTSLLLTGNERAGECRKRHNPLFAHAASFFTCAKQKQLHGRAKANLIGFNSERGSSGGEARQLKAKAFSCKAGIPHKLQKEGHNDVDDYL